MYVVYRAILLFYQKIFILNNKQYHEIEQADYNNLFVLGIIIEYYL